MVEMMGVARLELLLIREVGKPHQKVINIYFASIAFYTVGLHVIMSISYGSCD